MDGWKDGWMDGWMDGQTDRQTYLSTAIGLTFFGSSTVHIYTQTIHRTTQLILEVCGPCPFFASSFFFLLLFL
jgi:uncharacterized integral membrane protein